MYRMITDLVSFVLRPFFKARYFASVECDIGGHTYSACVFVAERIFPRWAAGLTIGRNIFILRGFEYDRHLLRHEFCHVVQGSNLGIKFIFLYLLDFIRAFVIEFFVKRRGLSKSWIEAYKAIRLEAEARECEVRELTCLYKWRGK